MKRHKYNAKKTVIDGITFASKKEALRYQDLILLAKAGQIKHLELQPRFPIKVEGTKVCIYVADFKYWDDMKGEWIVEDVKGYKTPVYTLKLKLFKALYGDDYRLVEV